MQKLNWTTNFDNFNVSLSNTPKIILTKKFLIFQINSIFKNKKLKYVKTSTFYYPIDYQLNNSLV